MKILTAFILTFTLNLGVVNACSCAYVSSYFCPTISQFPAHNVVQAKVLSISEPYMNIEILEQLDGQIAQTTITILGQDGLNCNEWLTNFQTNDTVVLGLFSYTANDTFDLSGCGKFFLHVISDSIIGMVDSLTSGLTYNEFKANLNNCKGVNSIDNKPNQQISIYPNPAQSQLNIKGQFNQLNRLKLYNSSGQIVKEESIENSNNYSLNLSGFSSGIYYLAIENEKNLSVNKVIITP